jgi:ABC-type multidrug transport system fused ATPase/permease subunit
MQATLGMIGFLVYWIITGFALYVTIHGEIVFATFLIISTYNGALTDRLWGINDVFKSFGKQMADIREGLEILDTPHAIVDTENAQVLQANEGCITFDTEKE